MTANKHKRALKRMLDKCCPKKFTLSGPEGRKLDCYSVMIDGNGTPYLVLITYQDSHIDCLEWIEDHYSKPVKIEFDEININKIKIVHYWHGWEIRYKSINDYRLRHVKFVYLRLKFKFIVDSLINSIYKNRPLITPDRMKLLKIILKQTLKNDDDKVSIYVIRDKLYSRGWVLHSRGVKMVKIMDLLLDSLMKSKWINTIGNGMTITGDGITALQEYEENRKRIRNDQWRQWVIIIATAVIAWASLEKLGCFK